MTMRPPRVFSGIAAGMLICFGGLGPALAQDEAQADQTQMLEQLGEDSGQASNPPGRVGRLSYEQGSVSVEPAGTSSWISAALNRPLTLGDKVWTDQSSRAEIDIGDAVIRLGSTTGFSFLNLTDQTAQMQITAGTVIVHVRKPWDGAHDEIDTPNLALTLERTGTYRVEVNDTGDTTVVKVVEKGEALVTGSGGQYYRVAAQQSATFTGTAKLTGRYQTLGGPDPLDVWAMQREQQEQQQSALAQQYLPPDMVGADDLGSDGNGTWEDTPDWGYAWFPDVDAGWAPYTLGDWVWVSPWGWTWIDEEPWGFAPFHYGRWGHWGKRWCWIPGPRQRRAVYAPALVGWVGGQNVGWFPLGPRDVYVPGYHASLAYVREINLTNVRKIDATDIANVYDGHVTGLRYANTGVAGGVTVVSRDVFTSGQPVGLHRVLLPGQAIASLRPTTAAPAIAPVRQSVLGVNAGWNVRVPPPALIDRPVVARLAPPRAPVSFTKEQAAIEANGGRPLAMTELSRLRPNTPAAPVRLVNAPPPYLGPGMSARERLLQQPTLAPGGVVRSDRPPWAQEQPGTQLRGAQTFVSPQRQLGPQQRFNAPARPPSSEQTPPQRFTQPRYNAPRVIEQRSAPHGRPSSPGMAPSRAPAAHPQGRPPPERRADAAPVSLGSHAARSAAHGSARFVVEGPWRIG